MSTTLRSLILAGSALLAMAPVAHAFDADAAEALFKKNNCAKCHKPAKEAKGPSLKKIATTFAGKPDAMDKLSKHLTTGPKVKMDDGTEEEHKIVEVKDKAELQNLIEWILSHNK
jgi:cytochrome c